MSYGLIPLGRKPDKELLDRYQYLQKFLKESKEFGAQRQESEKKAVNIALQNLARNSGYGDVTRLTWSMETELIKELLPYLSPKEIDGVEVYVQINEEGKSEIKQIKDGKELNSMPAKLKKHPYIEELKAVHKKLKDQYTRSRVMLEQAMEDCTRFEENELRKLMQNPVIWPLLRHLVFICNGQTGFYTDGLLVTVNAVCLPLKPKDELRIAHPTDLYASGDWHAYQKFLFDKAIRQPFKQVFRELYVPTPEEVEATQSRRYAGNQIQPQNGCRTERPSLGSRLRRRFAKDLLQREHHRHHLRHGRLVLSCRHRSSDVRICLLPQPQGLQADENLGDSSCHLLGSDERRRLGSKCSPCRKRRSGNQPLYHRDAQHVSGTDNAVVPFQERDDKRKFRSHRRQTG